MSSGSETSPRRADVLDARREAVLEWSALLGDATSCAMARDGQSYPAAKFFEGRVAALGELSRKSSDEMTAGEVSDTAAAVKARWATQVLPGSGHNRDWEAYGAGGVQAMTDIVTRGKAS